MSKGNPFDDQLRKAMDGFEPDVSGNWSEFESSLNKSSQTGIGSQSRKLSSISMVAALLTGGALIWVGEPLLEQWTENENVSSLETLSEIVQTSEELDGPADWEEFNSPPKSFEEDAMASSEPSPEMIRREEPVEVEKHSKSDDVIANSENDEVVLEELTLTPSDKDVNHSASEKVSSKTAHALDERKLLETLPIVASTGRSCAGVKVDFGVPGLDPKMSYLWNFGDGQFSSEPAPTHVFERPGMYDVSLTVRPVDEVDVYSRSIENMVEVMPNPNAQFSWDFPVAVAGKMVRVQLNDDTKDATSSQWVFSGQTATEDVIQLEVPGDYPINLIASNHHGCMGDVSHVIRIGDRYALQAQSRFSPNSDGKFDTFLPPGLQTISDAWEMVIVNTKGEVVFRTTDVSQPWDGSLPDGSIAANRSSYQWTVRVFGELPQLMTDRVLVER